MRNEMEGRMCLLRSSSHKANCAASRVIASTEWSAGQWRTESDDNVVAEAELHATPREFFRDRWMAGKVDDTIAALNCSMGVHIEALRV
jgi:hypothetical protein